MTANFIKVAMPHVGEEEVAAVRDVLLSGRYVSGPKVEEFERRFAEFIGTGYAIAVSSGTAALHIALEALGIGKGDEVIVPPLTFFATVSSVLYLGAIPVFADIAPEDLCLSAQSTESHITSRTKAIVPVHLFGAAARMDAFAALSLKYDIPIVEDCAQAHGTEHDGKKVGAIGNAGAFSFFATKHMTTGEGGMITTNNGAIANTCQILRNHGMTDRDTHERLGFNNRMTEMEAAMGLVQLEKLDELNERRISNSLYLIERIKQLPWARVPLPKYNTKHTFFWCPLIVEPLSDKTVETLKAHLHENGIGFRHRYSEPLYRQPALKGVGLDYSKIFLPNVEALAGRIIGLPNHPGLTQQDLDRIGDVLTAF
ncbi:MAG: DegT/DnrJ/EryC1/StrS aminotransferase family protein [Thermodesulfobacteriota bacterium]|nr:DegT/DnrJ/EryC1/StrS aminotransferase family protein [Thermodesulfobacteriota bacterium]